MSPRYRSITPIIAIMIVLALMPAIPARAATPCFNETGQCIADPLAVFWQRNGGLPALGFPIASLAPETNADTGQTYLTQWFERERLELHPENAPPYDILLGRLGAERLAQQGRDWTTLPKADPAAPHYFAVTGHAIAPQFWNSWRSHGLDLGDPGISGRESLALFGYPLSEPAKETNSSGDPVLTQWFERARFEYHPNNLDPYKVLLGLLGNEVRPAGVPSSVPAFDQRLDPTAALISYYNAINRREYQRAYAYWEQPKTSPSSTPPDYASFVQGYADTAYVAISLGTPQIDAGAGNVYAAVSIVIVATHSDGSRHVFSGCYALHHTNPGIDPRPDAALWKLRDAAITPAPSSATPTTLLPSITCPW